MLYLIPYPQTRLFEDLKFRDRESVKAFHSIVTSFTSLYASDKLFPPLISGHSRVVHVPPN